MDDLKWMDFTVGVLRDTGESLMGPERLTWQDDEKLWSDVIDQREAGEMKCQKVCKQGMHAFSQER